MGWKAVGTLEVPTGIIIKWAVEPWVGDVWS